MAVEWDKIGGFERYDKLNDILKSVGDKAIVTFLDDGKEVSAELLQSALKNKGMKNIKARNTIVFVCTNDAKKYEMWLSATAFSNLRELKAIRDANKNTLINAKVKVSRVSKDDMTQQAFKFESA
jgi:hypothetical protein